MSLINRPDSELRAAAEAVGHRAVAALRAAKEYQLAWKRGEDPAAAAAALREARWALHCAQDEVNKLAGLPLCDDHAWYALSQFERAARNEYAAGMRHGPVDGMWQTGAASSDAWSAALDAGVTEAQLSAVLAEVNAPAAPPVSA